MAESIVEQILAGFKTDIEAIEADGGTTYWNTFDAVIRCDVFQRNLLGNLDTYALIRDTGDDRPAPESAFGEETRQLDVWIQVHMRDPRGEKDPARASVGSGTYRNRLIEDVATKIMSDCRRSNLAIDTERMDENRDLDAPAGWIGAELLYVVSYYHNLGSP